MNKVVSYLRVSTQRQGRDGYGIEAQRNAVMDHIGSLGEVKLYKEFVEVESGKRNDRPELAKALRHCRVTGSALVIAKLDRLSRNARFLMELQESQIEFVCADMPYANRLTIGIMALMAEDEGKRISDRTQKALTAAKARGVKLGNPDKGKRLAEWNRENGNGKSVNSIKAKADKFALQVYPEIEDLRRQGITSYNGLAKALNERGVLTARKTGKWHASSVKEVIVRAEKLLGPDTEVAPSHLTSAGLPLYLAQSTSVGPRANSVERRM